MVSSIRYYSSSYIAIITDIWSIEDISKVSTLVASSDIISINQIVLDSVTAIEKATTILQVANKVIINIKGDWIHDCISKMGTIFGDIKGVKQIVLDSEAAIDVAADIIPLANKVVVKIPGYWSSPHQQSGRTSGHDKLEDYQCGAD